ncbi:alpha-E domain-containing protein [Limnoraphis robusta Tam1]|uniref:Alpha-E domain-containing protein n=1 Tax=Limnoraphis robusta CCNP1315 TaxID=3110306 RepID=A0ABU5U3K8_9CYAN|nr:alpha-E domain-containing protein [Limnoraphis robusta]MEA5499568.1 alpha-E domain-containing protein [Limnoraphis robusta BA-68 BA1]MEA5521650.1 alpha-E domain-containing protein [Limnoraphis robusta CCNP1315]MEA5542483.1 alpha-E domain-containing protein [Limnoraphis robusta Tam1]MEA5548185.1 alpha-E domain-containing protein [Limnoraphis robusta CCNP1324]
MLSRVASSVYWLNRYVERAENIARFVDVNRNLLLDSPSGLEQQWQPLVLITADLELFEERYGQATAENVIQFLTFDASYPNSILSCLKAARENARSIREIISSEMWEQVNEFYMMVRDAANGKNPYDLPEFFYKVKLNGHLFAGIMDATMSHNECWHFGNIGRLLERADKTSRILDVKYYILLPSVQDVGTTLDEIQWIALLKSTSAYEMYRKRQKRHQITPYGVVEFLILDREFPRSIQYCFIHAEQSLHQITGTHSGTWHNPAERELGRLRSELDYLSIDEITEIGLHEFLDNLQRRINLIGDKMFETFFALEPILNPVTISSRKTISTP